MANFEIIWADDFQKQLENLGAKFDEIAPQMIDEAAPILEESMKRKLLRHKDTGELINSIKAKKAKPVKGGGYYGYVTATGVAKGKVYKRARKKGGYSTEGYRNYQKMLALEFGTSKQPPTPFLQSAVNDAESEVLSKMQEVFNREVEKQ